MKKKITITLISLMTAMFVSAQQDFAKIEQTLIEFTQAGDQSDANKLDKLLDPTYRIVMNQLFGSTTVSVMEKNMYLDKIRNKEFGGDTRIITIHSIQINGNTATAMVTHKGTKMTFSSIVLLAKSAGGKWVLVSETPVLP